MAFIQYNVNPIKRRAGDCAIRAIAAALGKTWEEVYIGIVLKGFELCEMPSANSVWGAYLKDHGYVRYVIPGDRVADYTVADFAEDNPEGTYILALDGHVVCVKDGNYYDSWDSGDEVPHFYWMRREHNSQR